MCQALFRLLGPQGSANMASSGKLSPEHNFPATKCMQTGVNVL